MPHASVRIRLALPVLCVALLLIGNRASFAQVLAPNLVYTTIVPCRLIDTRVAGGALVAGTARAFNAVGVGSPGSLASQGGNPSGCPIPGFVSVLPQYQQVQAIEINLVAVGAAGPGDLQAWPSDQAKPAASVLNYASQGALAGLNIANAVIVPVRQDAQGSDFMVLAQVSGTHLVADVVGYFSSGNPANGSGRRNVALGPFAGRFNTTSTGNTAVGFSALQTTSSGGVNTAVGDSAMNDNTTGSDNTAVGSGALFLNTVGDDSTAVGAGALGIATGSAERNTAVGALSFADVTSGTDNIGMGYNIGRNVTTGSSNIYIGAGGAGNESNTLRIGTQGAGNGQQNATFIAGIDGATSAGGTAVFVNSSGQLGTATSSLRFKEDVRDMGDDSAGLMRLRPVTFHYKAAYDDGQRLLQYGLIAEEVAAVYPDLVQLDDGGQPVAVRYHLINAMLLNEVQKQEARIEELQARVAALAARAARVEELEARLAKLEARVAVPPRP